MINHYKKIFTMCLKSQFVPEWDKPKMNNEISDTNNNLTTVDELIVKAKENWVNQEDLQQILNQYYEDKSKLSNDTIRTLAMEVENIKLDYAQEAILENYAKYEYNMENSVDRDIQVTINNLAKTTDHNEMDEYLEKIRKLIWDEQYDTIVQLSHPLVMEDKVQKQSESIKQTTIEESEEVISEQVDEKEVQKQEDSININETQKVIRERNNAIEEEEKMKKENTEETSKKSKNIEQSKFEKAKNYTVDQLEKNWKTIEDLQKALGFEWNEVDGVIWPNTMFAIKKFQNENWLTADWYVWPNTLKYIKWETSNTEPIEEIIEEKSETKKPEENKKPEKLTKIPDQKTPEIEVSHREEEKQTIKETTETSQQHLNQKTPEEKWFMSKFKSFFSKAWDNASNIVESVTSFNKYDFEVLVDELKIMSAEQFTEKSKNESFKARLNSANQFATKNSSRLTEKIKTINDKLQNRTSLSYEEEQNLEVDLKTYKSLQELINLYKKLANQDI